MAIIVGTPTIGTSATTAFTNNSSSSVLVVGVAASFASGLGEDVSVTYNGANMSNSVKRLIDGSGSVFVFHMNSPSVGTYNVVVTPNASSIGTIRVFAVEIGNANTGQPGTTTTGIPSHEISTGIDLVCTGSNGVVFDVRIFNPENAGYSVGTGQTQLFNTIDMGQLANLTFASSYETYTSGTVNMSWNSGNVFDGYCLAEIKGIVPTAYTLTAATASFALTFLDAILKTVGLTNAAKPTTSFANTSKPTTAFTNVAKPSTSVTNTAKPNL